MGHATAAPALPLLGIMGFGAFGRLAADHLRPHFRLRIFDPGTTAMPHANDEFVELAGMAACPIVVLAVPVAQLAAAVASIAEHLRPGALVLDVASVKTGPAQIMLHGLPDHVDILATHPLFGPQSAKGGIAGMKIALCPLRGGQQHRVAAFLRRILGLQVIMTTPEAHDRDAALSQGLTHLIARIIVGMEPLPNQITTRSFGLLQEAVAMVRHDAPDVFEAIERGNPFAQDVRKRFVALAQSLDRELAVPG